MKEQYLQPEVEALNLAVEQAILDGSNIEDQNAKDEGWG